MKITHYFLAITIGFFMASCGSEPKEQTESTETHTDHQHSEMEIDGPALPKVDASARVFFANLKNGDKVKSPVLVKMGVEGIQVEPAGELKDGFGHHHILINMDSFPKGEAIPMDSVHLHFGKGQTETELNLPKGDYKLTMQFADGMHRSYGNQLSSTIVVTVE